MTPTLLLRRARRDLAVLLVWIALVAFAVVLAVGQPRLLQSTIDRGARQAVATAGSNADVFVTATVSPHADSEVPPVKPADIEGLASAIPHRLPGGLRTVLDSSTLSVVGPSTRLAAVNGAVPPGTSPISLQAAMITPQNSGGLKVMQGRLPSTDGTGKTVEVVLSAAVARASGLTVGSTATVSTIPVSSAISGGDHLTLRVVGIVSDSRVAGRDWTDVPNLWAPTVPKTVNSPTELTVLTDVSGVTIAARRYANPFKATVHLRLDANKFTAAREAAVNSELVALAGHSEQLSGNSGAQLGVVSEFSLALGTFPAEERAAIAQISIMVAGVLGVAAAVLLLISRMLVLRREADLSLERARGASLGAIFARSLTETIVAEVIGTAVGLALIQLLYPGRFIEPYLLVLVLAVAGLAAPVQTVLLVRGTWTGRKVPANLSDRVDLERRARTRRIALELTIVALAIAAFVSIATRGLLETQTSGVDPLLASAPVLLAASVTIVVLRVYRVPLRIGIAAGRRSTGALGLLAAVRAQRSIAVLPLLALSLAVALAVGGGLLASTVSAGQETASWQRIGADVRVRDTPTPAQLRALAKTPGVIAATGIHAYAGLQFRLSSGTNFATLVAVDPGFGRFVSRLPNAADASGIAALNKLTAHGANSGALPVVVGSALANQITTGDVGVYVGVRFVPIKVVGVTNYSPSGYFDAPFVFVDRSALAARIGKTVNPDIVLAIGPRAASAAAELHVPASAIHTRADWLSARRRLALVSGVNESITSATLATLLLAVLALIVTVLSGARERGRSLGLIRTLGLPARLGWWLALAELAPVLVAALVGGIVSGVGIVLLLEPAMGLRQLAGGIGDPAPTISLALLAALVGAAVGLLLLAVLIEILVRRRDRLSEVLRVGETP
ncbi:MAG TPA: FtsX-like permease family protein [Galbitalea sp.]|jgi:putative ABC transport system permease protein|nr:FtsX-like permease family protein [Galbitalea sp.]